MGAIPSHERLNSGAPGARPSARLTRDPADREGALVANRYRIAERIHVGRAGILYRAEDLAFARPVALRLLTPDLARDGHVLARLQARLAASAEMDREDRSASGDIVDLLDMGRADDGLVFVVTELLVGENLAAVLAREGPLDWPALRPLMVRACQILQLSHQHGLPRLDLQTRHLFPIRDKTATSTLKILSPGITDVLGDSLGAPDLRYAAPEQLAGGALDGRTDIYALGVIMFELLGGRVPDAHSANTPDSSNLAFPAAVRARLPEAVVSIVARALARRPEDRWPTMRALANAMAAIDFGPCDASGVLEMVHVEVPAPAASSTSMRIDLTAGHAPSPALRPRTMPPPRDASMAGGRPGIGGSDGSDAANSGASLHASSEGSRSVRRRVTSEPSARPSWSFAWAAAAVLAFGATIGALHVLRPRQDVATAVITAEPAVRAGTRDRGALPANIARSRASVLGGAAQREADADLSEETSRGPVDAQVFAPRDLPLGPSVGGPGAASDSSQWPGTQGDPSARASKDRGMHGGGTAIAAPRPRAQRQPGGW